MKKSILFFTIAICAVAARAQEPAATEVSRWLTEFAEVRLDGPFRVVLEQAPESEAPRIVYDTKGSYTSKFRAEVKEGVLHVTERRESKRETVTDVRVRCHTLSRLRIAGARVRCADTVRACTLDIAATGGAVLEGRFVTDDLEVEAAGRSRLVLAGRTRYLTLGAAAASKVDAAQLECMSAEAEASGGAEVSVCATDRLRARTAGSARISYSGTPSVLRIDRTFTGGEIAPAR